MGTCIIAVLAAAINTVATTAATRRGLIETATLEDFSPLEYPKLTDI